MLPIERLGLLADDTRRALYEYVIGRPHAVGREEAAAATATRRSLAAFHLDRLAEAGLLTVEYRRLNGRRGPGAGRPAKLYGRAAREVGANAPPRQYTVAAEVFADALASANVDEELVVRASRARGAELGRELSEAGIASADDVMAATGYAPVHDGGVTRALNCPFHRLAQRQLKVTCAMNVALLDAALEAASVGARAELDPSPDRCCVVVRAPS